MNIFCKLTFVSFCISDSKMRNKIFLACAIVLAFCVTLTVCCDEAVCVSIVSKCILIKSCDCDMTSLKNCTCCKDCQLCLSKLYTECCSCVGWYFTLLSLATSKMPITFYLSLMCFLVTHCHIVKRKLYFSWCYLKTMLMIVR